MQLQLKRMIDGQGKEYFALYRGSDYLNTIVLMDTFEVDDLIYQVKNQREAAAAGQSLPPLADMALAELEKRHILAALARYKGNRGQTASFLGISVRCLQMKLKDWKVEWKKGATCSAKSSQDSKNGVDIAGVKMAQALGYQTGGWMPFGWKTLDGPRPEYEGIYRARQTESASYAVRTGLNVQLGDVTIRIASDMNSRGELCTLRWLETHHKDHFDIHVDSVHKFSTRPDETPDLVASWIMKSGAKTVNIAGNSEKTSPGIEVWAARFLRRVFIQCMKRPS